MARVRILFLFSFLLFGYHYTSAQTQISGLVVDSTNNKPLAGVSIFINSSAIGTVSDRSGRFRISMISHSQILVFSSVGYKTSTITITPGKNYNDVVVKMAPKEIELDEVVIKSTKFSTVRSRYWKQRFIEYFIGTGVHANDCEIKNFSDIVLKISADGSVLRAQSDKPIVIVNSWLGYKIYYNIEGCFANTKTGIVVNYGFARFEDIGKGDIEYKQRRKELYLGSLTHFIKSLYSNTVYKEGFEVQRVSVSVNYERLRISEMLKKHKYKIDFQNGLLNIGDFVIDSSKYYYDVYVRQQDEIVNPQPEVLTEDSLVITNLEAVKEVYFKNKILVIYKNKKLDAFTFSSQISDLALQSNRRYPGSILSLTNDESLLIYANGSLSPPNVLFIQGSWKESNCVQNLMPNDFDQ